MDTIAPSSTDCDTETVTPTLRPASSTKHGDFILNHELARDFRRSHRHVVEIPVFLGDVCINLLGVGNPIQDYQAVRFRVEGLGFRVDFKTPST